jgi:hypothetical protein
VSYKATDSVVRFGNKNIFFYTLKNALAYNNVGVVGLAPAPAVIAIVSIFLGEGG